MPPGGAEPDRGPRATVRETGLSTSMASGGAAGKDMSAWGLLSGRLFSSEAIPEFEGEGMARVRLDWKLRCEISRNWGAF